MRSTARNDVKCHTEDNSPKYLMVGEILSILRSFACAQDDVKFMRHPELDATHVALCDSVGSYYRHWYRAFTLAEVLVTLGIIGVVSAMTVPTLMQNYQRQSYVTQLHKVYNETSQVFLRYMTDKNAINLREAGISSQAEMNNVITNYFKITNSCLNPNEVKPCFAAYSDYKKISGKALEYWSNNSGAGIGMSYILASGASVRFYYVGRDNLFISLVTDINGPKGPNILGRDMFDMTIDVNGNIDTSGYELPLPLTQEQRENAFQNTCIADNTNFGGCFGKILNDNWQMNY